MDKVCETPGCFNPHHARGLCQSCYDASRGKKKPRKKRAGGFRPHPEHGGVEVRRYNPETRLSELSETALLTWFRDEVGLDLEEVPAAERRSTMLGELFDLWCARLEWDKRRLGFGRSEEEAVALAISGGGIISLRGPFWRGEVEGWPGIGWHKYNPTTTLDEITRPIPAAWLEARSPFGERVASRLGGDYSGFYYVAEMEGEEIGGCGLTLGEAVEDMERRLLAED
jgi:hypothetical protein